MSKNKIGRPKKDRPATRLVAFRLTEGTFSALEKAAKAEVDEEGRSKSASEMARSLVIRALKVKRS
jgi:hypothetical protein